jgi:CMP-N-acetylneuraminic acid synthetase
MKTVAFIFARSGSKGLPGKNIRLLEGKPLIAWSIEHAFAVKKIDRVIVSTDCEEIAETARNYGAEVPFIRPSNLAEDDTPEWLAWRHALNYLMETSGSLPDIMISLPATAPLRLPIDIDNCLYEYEKGDVDVVITATDAHRNPFFNMVKLNEDGLVSLVNSSGSGIVRRQDVPIVYDMTTVCYVLSPEFVMNHNSLFEGKVKMIHIPAERAIDIDTLLDFHIAESILCLRRK